GTHHGPFFYSFLATCFMNSFAPATQSHPTPKSWKSASTTRTQLVTLPRACVRSRSLFTLNVLNALTVTCGGPELVGFAAPARYNCYILLCKVLLQLRGHVCLEKTSQSLNPDYTNYPEAD
ncbi:hypothetical protein C8R47DRAFT_1163911, partial [Mycena vitilis]